jgi:hypothetical protein
MCEHISSHHLPLYQTSARSEFKYLNMAAILENQLSAIDLKLCTYVPLGKSNSDQISVQSDSWLGHQGAKTKN